MGIYGSVIEGYHLQGCYTLSSIDEVVSTLGEQLIYSHVMDYMIPDNKPYLFTNNTSELYQVVVARSLPFPLLRDSCFMASVAISQTLSWPSCRLF